ncbi:MAG: IclR family transcriptional regulator [Usitatibacteraceae bacterium]
MPRKAAQPSHADQDAAPGGVAAVDRALDVLGAFRTGDAALSLAQLSERTLLYKSTLLRLLASLEHRRMILRTTEGRYGLGPDVARLHAIYARSFSLENLVMPVLKGLVAKTRESAAFHVRQGDQRLCLFRVDSPQPVGDNIRVGDLLPVGRGAGGRLLSAYSGGKGARYAQIRRDGYVVAVGDRVPELAGISAPVFDADSRFVGAITLTMPTPRLNREFVAPVVAAAGELSAALGGAPR